MKKILLMTFVLLLAVFCFASCKQGGTPSGSIDGTSGADVSGTGTGMFVMEYGEAKMQGEGGEIVDTQADTV